MLFIKEYVFLYYSIFVMFRIDDILADSDSDMDDEQNDVREKPKNKMDTYIREDPEMIVDLADTDIGSKITSKSPLF
jgi:hypothetical protein